ncbi:MAG TPA: Fe2+-dicitrate sensor protein, partial [Rikenellaceae bacterium]|nr:Fe2+-dicitrate sensor protein [Rikenellaceae bacterium]
NVYNVRIVIDRKDMPEIRYSRGKVRVSDGVDHALEMLSKASDFKWSHDRDTNVITIR